MKNSLIITIVLVILVGAGAFFGGMQYQKTQTGQTPTQGGRGQFRGRNGGNGMMSTVGQIISQDDKSITVKLQDGSSKIVLLSTNTSINKSAQATKSDLQNGVRVAVFGATNSDGSVTAQNIQINPILRMGSNSTPSAQTNQ